MSQPKITLVGAGGLSFGPTMVNDVIHTPSSPAAGSCSTTSTRRDSCAPTGSPPSSTPPTGRPSCSSRSTDPAGAFEGADFCISSAEHGRFRYWRQDYEIPRRHGATQVNGENGGPGAVFHSLRSIKNTLGICASIEKYCPDAFLVNLSNPMSRVTLAINEGTAVRNVGMCHEMPIGIVRIARLLRMRPSRIEAKASGINHFTFFTEMVDRHTGEDLLPQRSGTVRERKVFDFGPTLTRLAAATEAPAGAGHARRPALLRPSWPTWFGTTAWFPAPSTVTSASTCPSPTRSAATTPLTSTSSRGSTR